MKRKAMRRTRSGSLPVNVKMLVRARSGGWCEAQCGRRSEHIHHRRRRSQGGDDNLVNLLDLCLQCHGWIHANPAKSYELGYLLRSGS